MRKLFPILFLIAGLSLNGQVVISENPLAVPDASAMLHLDTQSGGMLIPRMTATERKNISNPAEGLWVYQTDENPGYLIFTGSQWVRIAKDRTLIGKVVFNDVAGTITGTGGYTGYTATYPGNGEFNVLFTTAFSAPPTVILTSEALPPVTVVDESNYCFPSHSQNCVPFFNADYLDRAQVRSCPGGICEPIAGPNSFNNPNTGCNNTPSNYVNYFDPPNTIEGTVFGTNVGSGGSAGSYFQITLASGPEWLDNLFAWIDWNQDGDFADANETVFEHYFSGGGTNNPAWAVAQTQDVNVPLTANNGITIMRAMSRFATGIPNPCGNFPYGETEDYKLNVLGATGASIAEPRGSNCNVNQITASGFKVNCLDVVSRARKGTSFDFYVSEH